MNKKTDIRQFIERYKLARKGNTKGYDHIDKLLDYLYNGHTRHKIPEIMKWLIENRSAECILDMVFHSLTFDNTVSPLDKKHRERIGTIYKCPSLKNI